MKEISNKTKEWFGKNKKEIKTCIVIAGCAVVIPAIYLSGRYVGALKAGQYMRVYHDIGFIKFFNIDTGTEIGVLEAIDFIKTIAISNK